jgi:hypothetical protein
MEERRKSRRMPITLSLEISDLYKQDNVQVSNLKAPIKVVNVSKDGIGFESESVLPIGYYFNANIEMGTDETLHSVVCIVRSQPGEGNTMVYGCEFIGMADVLSFIFDEFEEKLEQKEEE